MKENGPKVTGSKSYMYLFQKLSISLDLSAQDHLNDIKIIKIEQVKPIKNSFESVKLSW